MSKIVIFDLDGTLTRRDTYIEFLLGYLKRCPMRLLRTIHLPFALLLYKSGWRDNSWLKEVFLNAILGDLHKTSLCQWIQDYTETLIRTGLRPGAIASLRQHRQEGCLLILATASLDLYVEPLGKKLGYDDVICTRTAWTRDGRITGTLANKNCYGREKLERVKKWLGKTGETQVDVVYSDHHSDLLLLLFAKLGVAVNPTPALKAAATQHQLSVVDWE